MSFPARVAASGRVTPPYMSRNQSSFNAALSSAAQTTPTLSVQRMGAQSTLPSAPVPRSTDLLHATETEFSPLFKMLFHDLPEREFKQHAYKISEYDVAKKIYFLDRLRSLDMGAQHRFLYLLDSDPDLEAAFLSIPRNTPFQNMETFRDKLFAIRNGVDLVEGNNPRRW